MSASYLNNNYVVSNKLNENRYDWIWYLILFFMAFNLLNKTNYIFLSMVVIGIMITGYKNTKFRITLELLILLMFAISYFYINAYYYRPSINSFFIYFLSPLFSYIIGYFIVKEDYKFIQKSIISISLGYFFHGCFNMVKYLKQYGLYSETRNVMDIWGNTTLSATLQGTYFTLLGSMTFFIMIIWLEKRKKAYVLLFGGVLFSVFSSFLLGNRTLLIIIITTFISSALLLIFLKRSNVFDTMKNFVLIGVFFIFIFILYQGNIFGIKDFVFESNLYDRFLSASLQEDQRFDLMRLTLDQMFINPFGGHRADVRYAHNLWLDILLATGLIPFCLFLLYTFLIITSVIKIIIVRSAVISFKLLIVSVYTGLILNFMVEPILEAVPYMFIMFCLINGMLKKYLDCLEMRGIDSKEIRNEIC